MPSTPATADVGQLPRRYPGDRRRRRVGINPGAVADVGQLPRPDVGTQCWQPRRRRGRRPATRNRMIELNAGNPGDRGRRPATRDRGRRRVGINPGDRGRRPATPAGCRNSMLATPATADVGQLPVTAAAAVSESTPAPSRT